MVYGRPPALPLPVLRLDGAGLKTCSYAAAQTMKFTAEVAFYNTVATPNRYLFAFGHSPFLPYGTVSRSLPLEWTGSWAGNATQPGELWVKVVDATTGAVRVLSQRVPLNAQSRNVIGISLADDGTSIRLDTLQAENDTHTAPPVASGHFRLIFAHAALTLPPATISWHRSRNFSQPSGTASPYPGSSGAFLTSTCRTKPTPGSDRHVSCEASCLRRNPIRKPIPPKAPWYSDKLSHDPMG